MLESGSSCFGTLTRKGLPQNSEAASSHSPGLVLGFCPLPLTKEATQQTGLSLSFSSVK